MKKTHKKSGRRKVLIIAATLVIVGVFMGVGWYIWNKNNERSAVREYSDDFVSLAYPEGWVVERRDNEDLPGTKVLSVSSPETLWPLEQNDDKKLSLRLNVFLFNKESAVVGCEDCLVLGEVVDLDNPYITGAKLIFTEQDGPTHIPDGKADTIQVVTDKDIKVGNKGYGVVNTQDKGLLIWTDFGKGRELYDGGNFTSVKAIQSTREYEELIEILNSLTVK